METQLRLPQRCTAPQFSAHVRCGQTAGWMKTPLGTEVSRPRPHCIRREPSSPREKGTAAPLFQAHVYCGHGRPSQLLLSSFITFRVSRRLREMYIGHARLCVCLSLAAFPHYCTDPGVTGGMVGDAPCCALLGGFAIGSRVSLL